MYFINKNLKKYLFCPSLFFIIFLSGHSSHANESSLVAEEKPQLITQAEIQAGLFAVKNKMNSRIEVWGSKLNRNDFDRKRGKLVLKVSKQSEVCDIFQGVVDEAYQTAQDNKNRLSLDDQKIIENRDTFINALGISNHIIPTQLGFDCRVK